MEKANKKRLIISAVYLAIFLLVIGAIYSTVKPKSQICPSGTQNQNGKCVAQKITAAPLSTGDAGIVPSGVSGQYDFYGTVVNPNNVYGASSFNYDIKLKDASGQILAERTGQSYILPGDTKYIVETNFKPSATPSSYDFSVSNPSWTQFTNYYEKPDIEIVNKQYDEITDGTGFAQATGLLKNESPFDFDSITIRVILKDSSGHVIVLNSTEMNTVKSGENRDFRVFWPNHFPGEVSDVSTQTEVNIFNSQSFIKKYFSSSSN